MNTKLSDKEIIHGLSARVVEMDQELKDARAHTRRTSRETNKLKVERGKYKSLARRASQFVAKCASEDPEDLVGKYAAEWVKEMDELTEKETFKYLEDLKEAEEKASKASITITRPFGEDGGG